jgi:RNA:NAD 2'-phosphotransferase (TPT1/KptA family)
MFPHLEHLKENETNITELIKCIKLAWVAITTEEINTLINSLPRMIEACIRAQGWYM